jgi:hydrogenase expression/formation protein HypE
MNDGGTTRNDMRDHQVTLEHGAGGRAMRDLIANMFVSSFDGIDVDGIGLSALDDGAALRVGDRWLVVTTDSHVVHPIFFPGGDIGRLAVAGTVNDLAMMGAVRPLALTCSIILEEGFELTDLARVQNSLAATCREVGVPVVTGDTKVMGRGEMDAIVLNTTGLALTDRVVTDDAVQVGDVIVVTGTIGDHGLAVMSARNELGLEGQLLSDVAPINELIDEALGAAGEDLVAMKDPTRGGVAGALHEMATKSGVGIVLQQQRLPVSQAVAGAAELLGIDPLFVANEGKAVLVVRARSADRLVEALRVHPLGHSAAIIGEAVADNVGHIVLDTGFGRRLLPEPVGEPLPRIC